MVVVSDEKSQCLALFESASQPSGTWIPLPVFVQLRVVQTGSKGCAFPWLNLFDKALVLIHR
jgi:hypothetical protein